VHTQFVSAYDILTSGQLSGYGLRLPLLTVVMGWTRFRLLHRTR